jgi:hypothetical protein
MKTASADGAMVEIPLTMVTSKTSEVPIIVHREFHDE